MKLDIYKLADKHKLTDTEQNVLEYILKNTDEVLSKGVREVASHNFTSAATIIKLAKKMGFTGYIDMVYRLNFMIKNKENGSEMASIPGFTIDIPEQIIIDTVNILKKHKNEIIYVSATGFSSPLADYFCRKMLVLGYRCIKTNSYGVFDSNQIGGKLVIAISKSGETESITRVIDYSLKNKIDILSFTSQQSNYISRNSNINIPILDDRTLDDRNTTVNYFYARVLAIFEYIMDRIKDDV